jgi:hypothetical protein
MAEHFINQNELIQNGTINGTQIPLATLGIGNGAIDKTIQHPYFVAFAVNNTYDMFPPLEELTVEKHTMILW